MRRTRHLRRNFEERGSRIEDPDKTAKARRELGERGGLSGRPRKPRTPSRGDEAAPAEPRRVRVQGETIGVGVKRRRRVAVSVPRNADRKRFAHERPPHEPLPERPDQAPPPDRDWRPSDVPTEHTPTIAGFSLSGALLAIPISAVRFFLNVGVHAAHVIARLLQDKLGPRVAHRG